MSRSSALSRVLVQSNVLHILLAHALSTEKKEGATEIARVDGVSLLTRSEKRKDRVEIGPEQLTMAAIEAEEITKATGKTTRVIGWYHSHPHITVFPSHVDLRTQLSQQLMDMRFIGMIVSCFNADSELSDGAGCQHIKLPFSILNENPLDSLTLPKLLEIPERIFDEQRQSFYKSIPMSSTGPAGAAPPPPHRSNSSSGKSTRPFSLSPTRMFSFSSSNQKDREGDTVMSPTEELEAEERDAVRRSKNDRGSMDDIPQEELSTKYINHRTMSLPDRMTLIRNSGVYVQSLSSLVDNLVGPTLQMLVDREQYNQSLLESLQVQKLALLHQLKSAASVSSSVSQIDLVDLSDA
ncbi:BRCA1 BRCA2-containing complex, subunit 3 [Dissophora globulifera]|nr:BRCA1 BRCA2-containing complex, subunit 3 [Dissophora globulifera]